MNILHIISMDWLFLRKADTKELLKGEHIYSRMSIQGIKKELTLLVQPFYHPSRQAQTFYAKSKKLRMYVMHFTRHVMSMLHMCVCMYMCVYVCVCVCVVCVSVCVCEYVCVSNFYHPQVTLVSFTNVQRAGKRVSQLRHLTRLC